MSSIAVNAVAVNAVPAVNPKTLVSRARRLAKQYNLRLVKNRRKPIRQVAGWRDIERKNPVIEIINVPTGYQLQATVPVHGLNFELTLEQVMAILGVSR
jgi:hypothetical protein